MIEIKDVMETLKRSKAKTNEEAIYFLLKEMNLLQNVVINKIGGYSTYEVINNEKETRKVIEIANNILFKYGR